MAVEELLLRNPIVMLVIVLVGGKTFELFIHSFNKELCWDPEPCGFVEGTYMTYCIFTMVRKMLSRLLKWNLKSKTTTHCRTHFTVTVCRTNICTAPVTATWTMCWLFNCEILKMLFWNGCPESNGSYTTQYSGSWRHVYVTSHVFGGIKLLRDDRCPYKNSSRIKWDRPNWIRF